MNTVVDKRLPRLLGGWLMLALAGSLGAADIGASVGEAYDLESGELLYRETHCVSADGYDHRVIYEDAGGKLIARKLLDYSTGSTTPSFVQHNLYSNESVEVSLQRGAVSMAVIDNDSHDRIRPAVAQPSAALPVVIDAGFDAFVRQRWDELLPDGSLEFQFPYAHRSSLVELRVQPRSCSYATRSDQCFRLDLANWFFRMLVNPIELGYDADTRRLVRYRGLSNIGDGNGNGLVVDIRYSYDDSAPRACRAIEQTLTDRSPFGTRFEGQS